MQLLEIRMDRETMIVHAPHSKEGKRSIWPLIIVINLVAIAAIAWFAGAKRYFIPRHWEVVDTGMVYRSGELSSALVKKTWEKNHIKRVINLMGPEGDNPTDAKAAEEAARMLGIKQQFFPLIGDGTGEVENYVAAVKAIVEARAQKEPVVVHCATGTYRTGGVIAAYRTLVQGWSGQAAYNEMIAEGVKPGPATPLVVYLNQHIGEIAVRLVEDGVIEKVPDPLPVFGP